MAAIELSSKVGKVIIAIPVASLMTWQHELKVFPRLSKLTIWYTAKTATAVRHSYVQKLLCNENCIMVVTVTMLDCLIGRINQISTTIQKKNPSYVLEKFQWFMLDEAQMVKQAPSQKKGRRSRSVHTISKWSHRSVMISGNFWLL